MIINGDCGGTSEEGLRVLIEKYAKVALIIGVGIKQRKSLMLAGPISNTQLVRVLHRTAYEMGAEIVEVLWDDEQIALQRHRHAQRETFNRSFPRLRVNALLDATARGLSLCSVRADDPYLLADANATNIAAEKRFVMEHLEPVYTILGADKVPWNIIAAASPAWAKRVFPDLSEAEGMRLLWDAIFKACRIYEDDPIAAWNEHLDELNRRRTLLNERQFVQLRFFGPGTDLLFGMPNRHVWKGGRHTAPDGTVFVANMPTEENYCAPHRMSATGVVVSTKPLSYAGKRIDGIRLEFKDGGVVKASANVGEETLLKLLDTDEGARRIGEVAIVSHRSPISTQGILFHNTLFDENASCHIALGRAYATNVAGGENMKPEEKLDAGLNWSFEHVDFMIGGPEFNITGIDIGGASVPILQQGEFVLA